MDGPFRALHPDTSRYAEILKSRPKRIWIYHKAWELKTRRAPGAPEETIPHWKKHLQQAVHGIVTVQNWRVWHPESHPKSIRPVLGNLDKSGDGLPDTVAISPTGTTTLAWQQGCRRIGVIGVDILKEHAHSSFARWPIADVFFTTIAAQAREMGGVIRNLSPITTLKGFEASWTPSASSSAPTSGSVPQEPNPSSNTASGSTPPVPSTSPGCDQATLAGKLAS
jgi:hypothetical protein